MDLVARYATLAIFAVILYFIIDFIIGEIANAVDISTLAPNIKYYLCRLGIFKAINIYVSLLIASWFTNKMLDYLS